VFTNIRLRSRAGHATSICFNFTQWNLPPPSAAISPECGDIVADVSSHLRGIVKPHQSGTAWMPRANSQVPGCQRDPLTLSLGFGRRRGRLEVSSESCQKETGHYYFFRLLMLHVQWSRRLDSPRSATGLRARRSPLGTTIVAGYLTCRILVCSAA
jgi:hypothetical protein